MTTSVDKFSTPEARWAGVGPYYAMFPARFADGVVETYTDAGDTILDPFAGRGTALFSAATRGRHALGVEINPVGWVYAKTKLETAQRGPVENRIAEVYSRSGRFRVAATKLPSFFKSCYSPEVRAFLLAARKHLNWKTSVVDRTVMAILLVDLHGKRDTALSNQMRQTKAMSPDYAVRWWKERRLRPPRPDPLEFLMKKVKWRYARGTPSTAESRVYLADSTHRLPALEEAAFRFSPRGATLLFTSPPYLGVTNYHYDQWLRLWMLGGLPEPRSLKEKHRGKFGNPAEYKELLQNVFSRARDLLAPDATIYVRTDKRKATAAVTKEVLESVFSRHQLKCVRRPLKGPTQTHLFGQSDPSAGEVDLILQRG